MKKIKVLLYCCKAKPSLMKYENIDGYYTDTDPVLDKRALLNGKIVAECDFEVEKIELVEIPDYAGDECHTFVYDVLTDMQTKTLSEAQLLERSCLSQEKLYTYLDRGGAVEDYGYAIHIKNLHIFDEPRDIRNYYNIAPRTMEDCMNRKALLKAPQNMCNAYDVYKNHYILISIQPQWMCKILNGEKTIVVRKVVLKEMLENE